MTDPLWEARLRAEEKNRPYAVLHVIGKQGATPSTVGKALLVEMDGTSAGTIGGGKMEHKAAADAVDALLHGRDSYRAVYEGGGKDEETLVCSPHRVEVFCEIFRREMVVVICGNGHVGRRVAELSRFLDCETILFDRNPEYAENEFANECHCVEDYRTGLRNVQLPDGAYYFIGTDSHENDKEALAGILEKNPAYIGMLGSRRKVTTVCSRLKEEGVDPKRFDSLYSPAGLQIASMRPEEVAFSVVSEMLMIKNGGTGLSMRIPQTP